MGHEFDGIGELGVATAVVVVTVRVDDSRDRLVGDGSDQVENFLTVAFEFGIHQNHAVCRHEGHGVPTGQHALLGWGRRVAQEIEVLRDLLDTMYLGPGLPRLVGRRGQDDTQECQDHQARSALHPSSSISLCNISKLYHRDPRAQIRIGLQSLE